MRYGNADRMIELCHELQSTRIGWTLEDIQERFKVGKRTAQRMKNAVLRVYHQTEEYYDDERRKRWRIPQNFTTPVGEITADELADLEFAIRSLRKYNDRRRQKQRRRHCLLPVPLRSTYGRQWQRRPRCTNIPPGPLNGG